MVEDGDSVHYVYFCLIVRYIVINKILTKKFLCTIFTAAGSQSVQNVLRPTSAAIVSPTLSGPHRVCTESLSPDDDSLVVVDAMRPPSPGLQMRDDIIAYSGEDEVARDIPDEALVRMPSPQTEALADAGDASQVPLESNSVSTLHDCIVLVVVVVRFTLPLDSSSSPRRCRPLPSS